MIRKLLTVIALALPLSAFALDEVSALPEAHTKLIKSVTDELGIKDPSVETKKKIYGTFDHALKEGWYSYWVGNSDIKASKFKDDTVRIFEFMIVNDNRFNVITMTYFPRAGQIFVARRQFVEGASSVAMDAFKKKKQDAAFKLLNETNNYAFFQESGYVSFEVYHVSGSNAAVSYVDYYIIDVK